MESQSHPLDASSMRALLSSMGVDDYEPRVLHQLLEHMQRYAVEVFKDAEQYAEHAGRPGQLECEDVQLAARLNAAARQTCTPQFHDILARKRNEVPIKDPKNASNLQLPPERLCLTQENWNLHPPRPTAEAAPDASAFAGAAASAQAVGGGVEEPPQATALAAARGPVSVQWARAPARSGAAARAPMDTS